MSELNRTFYDGKKWVSVYDDKVQYFDNEKQEWIKEEWSPEDIKSCFEKTTIGHISLCGGDDLHLFFYFDDLVGWSRDGNCDQYFTVSPHNKHDRFNKLDNVSATLEKLEQLFEYFANTLITSSTDVHI